MIASRCGHVILCTRRRLDPHPILRHARAGHGARRWPCLETRGIPLPQGRVAAGVAGVLNRVAGASDARWSAAAGDASVQPILQTQEARMSGDDDAERSDEVEARPLAAARLGMPPPACGGERRI
jgi:hypothetical protein